jgi:DNA-binding NarL/FixJ family response regulator
MIRVAIVADSPALRAGLAAMIGAEPDLAIVDGECEADVVLVVHQQVAEGPSDDATEQEESDLDERSTRPATMVLLERLDADTAREAYGTGASAVLAIDANAEEVVAALRAVAARLVVVPPALSSDLLAPSRALPTYTAVTSATAVSLTPREQEVLALLAQGMANKMIAPRLGISEHTVKTHVAAVYEKLHARNRAEAVVAAARQGLVVL